MNAFTSVMQPDNRGNGLYMGCIGPANRRARMHIPGHGYHYHDEVNEFWEIRLKPSPEALVHDAEATAQRLLVQAQAQWDAAVRDGLASTAWFEEILHKARSAQQEGKHHMEALDAQAPRSIRLRTLARALRRFTACQCRAKQLVTELAHLQSAERPGPSLQPSDNET